MKTRPAVILILGIFVFAGCNLPSQNIQNEPAPTSNVDPPPLSQEASPTATATIQTEPTLTLTLTVIPTASPTPSVPTALFVMNANCRSGPDKTRDAVISFLKDETAEIVGRNNEMDNTWWYVKIPGSKGKCWVSTVTVNVIGSYDDIPTIPPPY